MADGNILVTDAGLAAVVNANRSGTTTVRISRAGLGTGKYTPASSRTSMSAKFKDIDTISGGGVGTHTIHVEIRDESEDSYTVYELGLFLSDGTLFAIASSQSPIMQKASGTTGIMVCDIALVDESVQNITFGSANFSVPQATLTTSGVAEIATLAEASEGEDYSRMITPKTLKSETDKLVHLAGPETVTGLKTFGQSPIVPTPGTGDRTTKAANTEWVKAIIAATLLAAHPVGSYYITEGTERPADLFGGTWEYVKDRFLIGAGYSFDVGDTGGSFNRQLSQDNLPAHTHAATSANAGQHSHTATTSENGNHAHQRGTMDITGTIPTAARFHKDWADGAFSYLKTGEQDGDDNGSSGGVFSFQASKSWTGWTTESGKHQHTLTTTSDGSHKHAVTVESAGGGESFSILNPYRAVFMWKRIA